jgi:hypothetical protein
VTALIMTLVFAGAYLLLAGQVSAGEAGAAVICAALASASLAAIAHISPRRFAFEAKAVTTLARAFASLPKAFIRVGMRLAATLADPTPGRTSTAAFVRGRRETPADATRRAVSVLALSLGPDSFVVRVRPDRDEIDVHAFVDKSLGDARWPA